MKVTAPFGIITACHAGDYFLAKATCASIRHYMPDVPICVIVDGEFSIDEIQKAYGVIEMRVGEIRDSRLREMCHRSTRSKLAAQWEGPFERYVWMDCDTVVLGDFEHAEPWHETGFWAMTTIEPGSVPDLNLRHYFMNPDEIRKIDPNFDASRHPLFCDGLYVARRNSLNLERFYDMWLKTKIQPDLFSWTKCQGLTNYMVFSSLQRGELTLRVCNRQYIVPDFSKEYSKAKFGEFSRLPPRLCSYPEIAHFCGQKPLIQNWRAYSALFTAFRLLHYRNVYGKGFFGSLRSWIKILSEEWQILKPRLFRKLGIKRMRKC